MDIYEDDIKNLFQENRQSRDLRAAARVADSKYEKSGFYNNVVSNYTLVSNQSTSYGEYERVSSYYTPAYKKLKEIKGDEVPDLKNYQDILSYVVENESQFEELKKQGHDIPTLAEMQASELKQLESESKAAEESFNGSLTDYLGWGVGAAGGYIFGDPLNTVTLGIGGVPKAGMSLLGNSLRIGAQEMAIEAGLQVKDKPAEIRARELQGEEISPEQALKESGVAILAAGALGGAAGGIVSAFTKSPDAVLKAIADEAPAGVKPKEHVINTLQRQRDIEEATEVLEKYEAGEIDIESVQQFEIDQATRDFSKEDITIGGTKDLDTDEIVGGESMKEATKTYKDESMILNKLKECLL